MLPNEETWAAPLPPPPCDGATCMCFIKSGITELSEAIIVRSWEITGSGVLLQRL